MAEDPSTRYCSNCKRDIASGNFVMHEVHCRRNLILCEHCQEPVPRSDLDAHFEEFHAKVPCSRCGEQFEKTAVKEHEDEHCPKRPMHCAYCELEFPQADLAGHLDYCGSRTEPCEKCGQFIMLKEFNRHQDSKCTYPVPKVTNNNTAANHNNGRDHLDDYINNFAAEELGRMMNLQGEERIQNPISNPLGSGASGINPIERPAPNTRKNRNTLPKNQNDSALYGRGSQGSRRNPVVRSKNSERREENGRRTRDREARAFPPANMRGRDKKEPNRTGPSNLAADSDFSQPGEDMDHLLAMHLAHDLSNTEDVDEIFQSVGSQSEVNQRSPTPPITPQQPSDSFMLPCEFCGEPFPTDILIQHQGVCTTQQQSSSAAPQAERVMEGSLPNNSPKRTPSRGSASQPQILDNLSYLAAHDWLSHRAGNEFVTEEVLLPCEFCDSLFPEEFIVQHQAICDSNVSMTPRVQSPNVSHVRSAQSSHVVSQPQQGERSPIGRPRRQPDPNLAFLTEHDLSTARNRNTKNSQRAHRAAMSKNLNSTNEFSASASKFDTSSKYKRGLKNKPLKSRPEHRTVNSGSSEENGAQANGATKSKKTLDDLLQDPKYGTYDLLAHIDGEPESWSSGGASRIAPSEAAIGTTGRTSARKVDIDNNSATRVGVPIVGRMGKVDLDNKVVEEMQDMMRERDRRRGGSGRSRGQGQGRNGARVSEAEMAELPSYQASFASGNPPPARNATKSSKNRSLPKATPEIPPGAPLRVSRSGRPTNTFGAESGAVPKQKKIGTKNKRQTKEDQ